jgi:fibronectin type 3 domain-containing protein
MVYGCIFLAFSLFIGCKDLMHPEGPSVPDIPTAITTEAVSTSANRVSWDTVSRAQQYEVYDGTNSHTTSYSYLTITELAEDTVYYFTVKAGNDAGWSAASSPVSGTTQKSAQVIPVRPNSIAAIGESTTTIRVSWNVVPGTDIYEVSDGTNLYTTNLNYHLITELAEDTVYYFTVKAGNNAGWSAVSSPVSAKTLASGSIEAVPEAPPAATIQEQSSNAVTLSWQAVTGASRYAVYYGTTAAAIDNIGGETSDLSLAVTGLQAQALYYFAIKAGNSAGWSEASEPVQAATSAPEDGPVDPAAPAAPQNLSTTVQSASSISLSWSAVTGAASYKVYRSTGDTGAYADIGTATDASYTDAGLTASTAYYYKVSAVDSEDLEGARSTSASATTNAAEPETPAPPAAPQDLSAEADLPGSISLSWSIVTGAAAYKVYRSSSSSGAYAVIDTVAGITYTDTGLTASTAYYYKVSAVNSTGAEGAQSAMVAATASAVAGPVKVPSSSISGALTWIDENAVSGGSYLVELGSSEFIGPTSLSYSGKTNITITLKGTGANRIISLNSTNGTLFTIRSGVTLILDTRITLNGRSGNTHPLVHVYSGGTLIMNEGAKITGNTSRSSYYDGGGVYVAGTFTMKGGEISGNKVSSSYCYGGGVYVNSNGAFTMSGGKISGNSASSSNIAVGGGVYVAGTFIMSGGEISGNSSFNGGGVYVAGNGTFIMGNGKISGNTSSSSSSSLAAYGGGIYITTNGTFTMNDGEISGNTVSSSSSSYGGGVYAGNSGIFTMNGGRINGNNAARGGGVAVNTTGLFTKAGTGKKRNITAGIGVEMDSLASGSAGGWE